jgi:arylformamidase
VGKAKKIKWIGVDCGSADHPMNTIIRNWMPRQAAEADKPFQREVRQRVGRGVHDDKYQLMHIEMFPYGIIHAECLGGDIDLLLNRRVTTIGFFPWRFVDGESCIGRCVAFGRRRRVRHAQDPLRRRHWPAASYGEAHQHLVQVRLNNSPVT